MQSSSHQLICTTSNQIKEFNFLFVQFNTAMPVQQLVLHPTVNRSIKYASTTVGRDKVYRAVQNLARFLAWYLKRQDYNNKEIIQRFSNLKSALGLSRKRMF